MKFVIAVLCFVSALCVANAQFGGPGLGAPGIAPGVGGPLGVAPGGLPLSPLGMPLGLGMPPFGLGIPPFGLGIPPFGLGLGLGLPFFPPFLPFMRPGFGFRRFGLLGKRSVDGEVPEIANGTETESNRTLCHYSSQSDKLVCHGSVHNFECDVQENLIGLEGIKLRLADLKIVPEVVNKVELFRILARRSMMSSITAVNPMTKKDLVLSFYNQENVSEPGFLIKDQKCWSQFESLVRTSTPEDVRLALFVNQ